MAQQEENTTITEDLQTLSAKILELSKINKLPEQNAIELNKDLLKIYNKINNSQSLPTPPTTNDPTTPTTTPYHNPYGDHGTQMNHHFSPYIHDYDPDEDDEHDEDDEEEPEGEFYNYNTRGTITTRTSSSRLRRTPNFTISPNAILQRMNAMPPRTHNQSILFPYT